MVSMVSKLFNKSFICLFVVNPNLPQGPILWRGASYCKVLTSIVFIIIITTSTIIIIVIILL